MRALPMGRNAAAAAAAAVDAEKKGGMQEEEKEEEEEDGFLVKLVEIDGGVDICDVDVGDGHVVVITTSGDVWVAGENSWGQLGLGLGLGLGGGRFVAEWVSFSSLLLFFFWQKTSPSSVITIEREREREIFRC